MKKILVLILVFGSVSAFAFSEAQCIKHGGVVAMNGSTKFCKGGALDGKVILSLIMPSS